MKWKGFRVVRAVPSQRGFTVLELMITITIVSLALALGMPSMMNTIEKRRTVGAAERIWSELQLARAVSVARSEQVFANISGGANWAFGVSDDPNCDPTDNNPACTLPDMNDANEVLHIISNADFDRISLATTAAQITFSPQRATATAATIDIASTDDMGYLMRVEVGVLGQISMCSPDADPTKYVTGYRAC